MNLAEGIAHEQKRIAACLSAQKILIQPAIDIALEIGTTTQEKAGLAKAALLALHDQAEAVLSQSFDAVASGDVVKMLEVYQKLKNIETEAKP